MILKFNKTDDGDISVVILNGTTQDVFSYVKMVSALLDGEHIECEFGDRITQEEQDQINALNDAIWKKVHSEGEHGEMTLFGK